MGERGDQRCPLPHIPRLLRLDGVIKSLREGERSAWAAEDPRSGRALVVADPGLQQRPVARAHWQGFLATWPAGWPADSSQVDRVPAYEKRSSPKSARTSKAGPSG